MAYKPKSTTKKAKRLIRNEALSKYSRKNGYRKGTRLENMKCDADAYNAGTARRKGYPLSDYTKGAALVDAGCYRCYYDDQRDFLGKIYGRKKVSTWSNDKTHNTYKHLIGREYSAMLQEKKKAGKK